MAADPDGSSGAEGQPGAAHEPGRAAPMIRGPWRGPGWRVVDAHPGQGRQVRRWITGVVGRHGGPADPGDAALVVSELFGNAVQHGPSSGRVLVGYCLWPGGARIVVCDAGGPATPQLCDPGELAESGRGLQVVDAVAAAWGSFLAGGAQAVWCDLGQPLGNSAEAWAWLQPVLAGTRLAAPRAQTAAMGWPGRGMPARHLAFALA